MYFYDSIKEQEKKKKSCYACYQNSSFSFCGRPLREQLMFPGLLKACCRHNYGDNSDNAVGKETLSALKKNMNRSAQVNFISRLLLIQRGGGGGGWCCGHGTVARCSSDVLTSPNLLTALPGVAFVVGNKHGGAEVAEFRARRRTRCARRRTPHAQTHTHTPPFFFSRSMRSRPLTAGLQIGLKRWQLRGRTRVGWKYSQRACRAKRSKSPTPRSCRDVVAKPWRAE